MKISDALWVAANEELYPGEGSREGQTIFSCWAAERACKADSKLSDKTCSFLCSLGVDCSRGFQFMEFEADEDRQQARYNWLMFAYEIALEEGL